MRKTYLFDLELLWHFLPAYEFKGKPTDTAGYQDGIKRVRTALDMLKMVRHGTKNKGFY